MYIKDQPNTNTILTNKNIIKSNIDIVSDKYILDNDISNDIIQEECHNTPKLTININIIPSKTTVQSLPSTQLTQKILPKPKVTQPKTPSKQNSICFEKCNKLCGCYSKKSIDSRCCGLCYHCYPSTHKSLHCECCPSTLSIFFSSGYFVTKATPGPDDGCYTCLCCPLKFPLFFPCLIGSAINNCINLICKLNDNNNFLF